MDRQSSLGAWASVSTAKAFVHTRVEECAEQMPDAVAVVHRDRHLTFEALNERAAQLASKLIAAGVGADERVAVFFERSVEMVIVLLAVLKSGGAYVPLDPSYPTQRLREMVGNATPRLLLTQSDLLDHAHETFPGTVVIDAARWLRADLPTQDRGASDSALAGENLVYVIYTSGSTGKPKGIAMPHAAAANLMDWHRDVFGTSERPHVLQFAALSFDVAFQEIFSTLCAGGTLVLPDESIRRDMRALADFLKSRSVQRIFLPPTVLLRLADVLKAERMALESLQDVICAGERLRITEEVKSFFSDHRGATLHNHYGPTETHVVTALTLTDDPSCWPAYPSIGKTISNTWIGILDERQQLLPIGETGEICIGGRCLARGYLGQGDQTASRFVSASELSEGSRLYKTGDLGRWLSDGNVEYMGRNDSQIKIRGYRVELAEIEMCLLRHANVKDVVVLCREDVPGDKRLTAYFTTRDGYLPSLSDLIQHTKTALPDYMVPSAFVHLQGFALTSNGKVDRQSLPRPAEHQLLDRVTYDEPQGDTEVALAHLWKELLGVPQLHRSDDFFGLGGHSLLAMDLLELLEARFAVTLSYVTLLEYPTLSLLAQCIDANVSGGEFQSRVAEGAPDAINRQ